LALPDVIETSVALASVYLRYNPTEQTPENITKILRQVLSQRDWYAADLPKNRTLWIVPTVFDPDVAVQIEEAAKLAGCSVEEAVGDITAKPVRVLALGFAPGQPYLGTLPERWNLPRQTELTKRIPAGALALAVRQMVLFTNDAPTGWRHVGQTGFKNFRPELKDAFALKPGDEMCFRSVSRDELEDLISSDTSGMGGATARPLT
jgi:KipI family sensor histidine kinase inhibitor